MTQHNGDDKKPPTEALAARLAAEAQIDKDQARELIRLIGTDWNSLLREARFLKRRS
jgi:hypothetical protein